MSNKGFSLNSEKENPSSRVLQFQASALDFDETPLNHEMWYAAHSDPRESKTPKFVGFSVALHAALLGSVMLLSAPLFEPPKTETVTIEITDSAPAPMPRGSRVAETLGQVAEAAPQAAVEETAAPGDVVIPKKTAKQVPRKATPAKAARMAPKAAKVTSVAKVKPVVAESPVEVPEEIDKLDAPELDENQFAAATAGDFNESDLDKGFARVDRKNEKNLKALKDEMNGDAAALEQEQDSALDDMDRENQQEARTLNERTDALKKRNAALIAAAQAQENAAREAAARKAALAAAAGRGANGSAAQGRTALGADKGGGTGSQPNPGAGNQGAAVAGAAAGIPQGGVRDISQIRQMPGNPRPAYSETERLNRQQGEVTYLAYITKAGFPMEFRQVRSTGYANLDAKTLTALKKWKFYPGQEGWVQIPFKWDLKGGPQETSALGRRVSRK